MSDVPIVLVPAAIIDALVASQAPWGFLTLRTDQTEQVELVVGYSAEHGGMNNALASHFVREHYLSTYDARADAVWYRVPSELRDVWEMLSRQRAAIATSVLEGVVQGWRQPPLDAAVLVITIDTDSNPRAVEAWHVTRELAQPVPSIEVSDEPDRTALLRPGWPIDELADKQITVIGIGSIGSAATEGLADYGVHHLTLVDPDRLFPHNLVRHRAHRRWVGRLKTSAQRASLLEQYPYLDIVEFPVGIADAADTLRPILRDSDVVVCCADGIEARVVASHLTRWAHTPLVLACVLDDGAFGEVLRLRPSPRIGCLLCQREHMRDRQELDPEPGLDLPYGTGSRHRAMTAVGGDLAFVGRFAAKVAVSTVLETLGHPDQRLPGEHAIVSLRSPADAAPPFDLPRSGELRWRDVTAPRADCPICGIA